jgi:hypothetical protein
MIDIKIDIVPFGDEELRHEIGNIKIVNDGTSEEYDTGNYTYRITKDDNSTIVGKILGFKRIEHDIYSLLKIILNGEEKIKGG